VGGGGGQRGAASRVPLGGGAALLIFLLYIPDEPSPGRHVDIHLRVPRHLVVLEHALLPPQVGLARYHRV